MDLDRALSKLKFDESVLGYTLMTNEGYPFLSFSMPEDVIPQVKGFLRIHSTSLKMMNIMSEHGTVVLARVDPNWVLAVVFAEVQLGIALQKAGDVIRLLEQVELPPPPAIASEEAPPKAEPTVEAPPVEEPAPEPPPTEEVIPVESVEVRPGCVVKQGPQYVQAMTIDSELNQSLRRVSPVGMDVLLMVDQKRTVYKIAETLARSVDKIAGIIRWCVSQRIVELECPDVQESGPRVIVEVPLFDGDIGKVKKEHRRVLELCDGTMTLNEIADELGIQYFKALQSVLPYKGRGFRFVKMDKVLET